MVLRYCCHLVSTCCQTLLGVNEHVFPWSFSIVVLPETVHSWSPHVALYVALNSAVQEGCLKILSPLSCPSSSDWQAPALISPSNIPHPPVLFPFVFVLIEGGLCALFVFVCFVSSENTGVVCSQNKLVVQYKPLLVRTQNPLLVRTRTTSLFCFVMSSLSHL